MSKAVYERVIRFADVDAAGFVFFANYLAFCHEAYEDSLLQAGIELRSFFIAQATMLPIARAQVQYLAPLESGHKLRVELTGSRLSESGYRLDYKLLRADVNKLAGLAQTEHAAIDFTTRARKAIPPDLAKWLESVAP